MGRFLASLFIKVVKPRYILLTYMSGTVVFIAAAIGTKGNTDIAMLSLVLFFESCIFLTTFTMPLRGLGRHTKRDASFLVSSVSGGAVPPPILGAVTDAKDAKIMMCNAAGRLSNYMTLPIYLNLIKAKELDGLGKLEWESRVQLMLSPLRKVIMRKIWRLPGLRL